MLIIVLARAQIGRFEVIDVRAVGDVVAFLFEPVAQRVFPQQKLAAAHALRVVEDLHILAVGPVKAATDARRMRRARIGVERFVHRPAVVGLPGVVAALEEDVRRAVVFDDEDDVALPVGFVGGFGHGRETAKIDAAGPVGGNGECGEASHWHSRSRLSPISGTGCSLPIERAERGHQARARAVVVAHAEDVDGEFEPLASC
jgi:hypothetical protein